MPGGVEPGGLELQLIIARHFDERTPAKGSLEASSKPGKWATGRKSHVFKRKFLSLPQKALGKAFSQLSAFI